MGSFVEEELLGMQWLDRLVVRLLAYFGIQTTSRIGGSLRFFLYDVAKISILLCVLIFLVSFIQSFFPPERSRSIMGRFHGFWANVMAALLGTVTPFCSCSSIPIFMGFTSAGLPLGVTFSFLISSPMVDLGSLLLLIGVFGYRVALSYVLVGLAVAVAGGILIGHLGMEDQVEAYIRGSHFMPNGGVAEQSWRDRSRYAKDQTASTFRKVFPYILAGVGLGAVIHNWIPQTLVESVLGSRNPFGVVIATLIGAPMYADIFGTIPVAEALLAKGALLGTVLSFMMAVTTLSLPSLVLLRKAVKPKLLATFVAICMVWILIVGYAFNLFQQFLW